MSRKEAIDRDSGANAFAALHECWINFFQAGKFDEALALARAGNELFPAEPQSGFDYGASLVLAGHDPAEARMALEQALERPGRFTTTAPPERARALANLGRVLLAQGQAGAARERLAEALKIDPGQAEILYEIAAADQKVGDAPSCLAHSKQAFEISPDKADRDAYLVGAWAYLRLGEAAGAEALLRRGIESLPNEPGLHLNLGYALAEQGKPVEALLEYLYEIENGSADSPYTMEAAKLFRETIAKPQASPQIAPPAVPKISEATAALRDILAEKPSDPTAALAGLLKLDQLGYKHSSLELLRAGNLYARGEKRAAERVLRTLIEADPAFLPPYYDLSQILTDSGREVEARRFVAEAVRRNPSHWQLTGRFPLADID